MTVEGGSRIFHIRASSTASSRYLNAQVAFDTSTSRLFANGTEMPGGLSRWLSGLDKVPRADELTKIYRRDTKRPRCCKCVEVCSGVYTNAESLEG